MCCLKMRFIIPFQKNVVEGSSGVQMVTALRNGSDATTMSTVGMGVMKKTVRSNYILIDTILGRLLKKHASLRHQ